MNSNDTTYAEYVKLSHEASAAELARDQAEKEIFRIREIALEAQTRADEAWRGDDEEDQEACQRAADEAWMALSAAKAAYTSTWRAWVKAMQAMHAAYDRLSGVKS